MSLYKNIFRQAVNLTWKNKYFWYLGVFTVFFSTSVELEMADNFFGRSNNAATLKTLLESGFLKAGTVTTLEKWLKTDNQSFYGAAISLVSLLVIFLVIVVISVIAQIIITSHSASLIKTQASLKNPKKFNLFSEIVKIKPQILPIALMDIALKLAVNILLLIIGLPLAFGNATILSNWLYVVGFIIFFPVAIIIAFVIRYMTCFLIIKGQSVKSAIINGYNLFKENWLVSAEMSLMLFLFNLLASMLVVFIILAVANPLWFLAIIANQYLFTGAFYVVLAISYVVYFALFAWGASLISVFNISSWTGLFVKLDKTGGESKISRVFSTIVK